MEGLGLIRVGTWGRPSGDPQNDWSFQLEPNYHLSKITIDHGDLIYSLIFTSQYGESVHNSEKAGGWNGGEKVSEITFDEDEEINGISGTVALSRGDFAGYTIISSISFMTNKKTHGPFGDARGTPFTVPWKGGSFAGFYGLAGYYIDSIGIYVIPHEESMSIGTWGTTLPGGPQNNWSFQLEPNYHLSKITIDHGDLIYSLIFTSQYGELTHTSEKVGGWNGGENVSEITLDVDEEINGISGTVALSRGAFAGYTVISSISFMTNKTTHGPFGDARGTPFTVPWNGGSFAGFYGLAGYYIDSIGIYMKPHEESMKIGTWGRTLPGGPQNDWSFQLEPYYHLSKITIDHGDLIYSLIFTSQYGDLMHTSEKAGGWNGGEKVSEITLDVDEEINGISGTIALSRGDFAGYTVISSISFMTNKKTHGPFGDARGTPFTVPWKGGSFAGFYGLAGYYIDSIGVYVKPNEKIMSIGTWGRTLPGGPQNDWSFQLEPKYHLTKITIDHGDLIYSLIFTSKYGDSTHASEKAGGWNGGENVSEITFDEDEEINGISGTVALSRGAFAGYTVISSISFMTNKKTHGPFGDARGTPFTVPWKDGSFAGFYGLAGYYIDSIGVYLKDTNR